MLATDGTPVELSRNNIYLPGGARLSRKVCDELTVAPSMNSTLAKMQFGPCPFQRSNRLRGQLGRS